MQEIFMKKIKMYILFIMILLCNVVCGEINNCATIHSLLINIHDELAVTMHNCVLGEKLVLKHVLLACNELNILRKSGTVLTVDDEKIVHNIVQLINDRLIN